MKYMPLDQHQARLRRQVVEDRRLLELSAIRNEVWGPPAPYEDEFWAAKFDGINAVSPTWSWTAFIDWIHRYDEQ